MEFKICLIGLENSGKSSFINRLIYDKFDAEINRPAADVEFHSKIYFHGVNNQAISYQFGDRASDSAQFESFLNESNAILAFYDITNRESYLYIQNKLAELEQNDFVILLLGNKIDLEDRREVELAEAQLYALDNGFLFSEISVKNAININQCLDLISDQLLKKFASNVNNSSKSAKKAVQLPKISSSINLVQHQTSRSQIIDVKSNSLLLSNLTYHNKVHDAETRRIISDLADQIKFLKNELDRKDQLISQISTTRESARGSTSEFVQAESMFTLSKIESYKKDFEAKYEKVAYELFEERAKNKLKEEQIEELKLEIVRLNKEIQHECVSKEQLALKLCELQTQIHNYESANEKSILTIKTLQSDVQQLQDKVLDLESSLRVSAKESLVLEQTCASLKQQIASFTTQITVNTETLTNADNVDLVVKKFEELKIENAHFRKELNESKAREQNFELESKTHREKCAQMTSDIRSFESEILDYKIQCSNMKAERDAALSAKQVIENDIHLLKSKLSETQRVWLETQRELDFKDNKCTSIEANMRKVEQSNEADATSFKLFKNECAKLLSDELIKCESSEEDIKEKIELLMVSSKHRGIMLASLEKQVDMLNAQLTQEINSHNEAKIELNLFRSKTEDLESQRTSVDIQIIDLRKTIEHHESDRARVYEFLNKLARIYRLPISSTAICQTSIEKNLEVIINRLSKEVQSSAETFSRQKEIEFDREKYENKVKLLKEELNNKEIHLNLMRKKLSEWEEEHGSSRSEMRKELDKQLIDAKKTNLKFERLVDEVNKLRSENIANKSQLLDIQKLYAEKAEKEEEIRQLCLRVADLEKENKDCWLKIHDLRNEFESTTNDLDKTRLSTDSVIKSLNLEIKALKFELEKSKSREEQLLDFRYRVCAKLGLNSNGLSIADYEILARVEGLYAQCVPVLNQNVQLIASNCVPVAQANAILNYPCITTTAAHLTPALNYASSLSSNIDYNKH